MRVETKFLRLFHPVAVGDHIDGWRVCWMLWDHGVEFFIHPAMLVNRQSRFRSFPSRIEKVCRGA
jgi:hypothetical protein